MSHDAPPSAARSQLVPSPPGSPPDRLWAYLRDRHATVITLTHPPCRTSDESRRVRAAAGHDVIGAKAVVMMAKVRGQPHRKPWLLVLPGDRQIDVRRVCSQIDGVKSLRLATAAELVDATDGLEPGMIPPLGPPVLPGVRSVLLDAGLLSYNRVGFNAATLTRSIVCTISELVRLTRANAILPITTDPPAAASGLQK